MSSTSLKCGKESEVVLLGIYRQRLHEITDLIAHSHHVSPIKTIASSGSSGSTNHSSGTHATTTITDSDSSSSPIDGRKNSYVKPLTLNHSLSPEWDLTTLIKSTESVEIAANKEISKVETGAKRSSGTSAAGLVSWIKKLARTGSSKKLTGSSKALTMLESLLPSLSTTGSYRRCENNSHHLHSLTFNYLSPFCISDLYYRLPTYTKPLLLYNDCYFVHLIHKLLDPSYTIITLMYPTEREMQLWLMAIAERKELTIQHSTTMVQEMETSIGNHPTIACHPDCYLSHTSTLSQYHTHNQITISSFHFTNIRLALYESYIDCYDEIINETLKISFEITKEISDLRIAESFNEALVCRCYDRYIWHPY